MKCKKSIMGYAALLIVFFHFYIPFGKSGFETFLYRSAYIGVDLFFFVSALSLGSRKEFKIGSFYLNRLFSTYIPFVVLAAINTVYTNVKVRGWQLASWKLTKFVDAVIGKDLIKRGGGAFLWFLPGIVILYLITPLFVLLKKKFGIKALPMLLAAWAAIVCILQFGFKYTALFVLLNRIPIFLLGFFYDSWHKVDLRKFKLPVALLGIVIGSLLVWKFGTLNRLNKPITDIYYVIAIPLCLSIVELFDWLYKKLPFKILPLEFIGGFTLELYGLQMIFGYAIEMKLMKLKINNQLVFLLTVLALILMAYLYHLLRMAVRKLPEITKEKRKK